MSRIVIVPGIFDSGPAHWQTLWQQDDPGMVRIAPSSFDVPVLADWLDAIDRAVDAAGEDCVLVAHSLGTLAAGSWLADAARARPGRVAAAVLVAPADPQHTGFPAGGADFVGWEPEPVRIPTLVLSSTNDPYCTAGRVSEFAIGWGAGETSLGALTHINAESGLGAWPEGRRLVDEFVASECAVPVR